MPKLEYFVICEAVSIDQETNRVSLFNVLEDFRLSPEVEADTGRPSSPPGVLAGFVAVACLNKLDTDEHKDHIGQLVVSFNGNEVSRAETSFTMEHLRSRIVIRFVGFPKLTQGKLQFELLIDGQHYAEHTTNILP